MEEFSDLENHLINDWFFLLQVVRMVQKWSVIIVDAWIAAGEEFHEAQHTYVHICDSFVNFLAIDIDRIFPDKICVQYLEKFWSNFP